MARESPTIAAQVVSVGSLLRREGRAPHAQDRPLEPRAVRQAENVGIGAWPARPAAGRRRATAVAGGLVAAGSVLGAALYNGAASNSSEAQTAADGLFPGMGLPSGSTGAALPDGYLPANVSLTNPLPAPAVLAPGTTDWVRFAFPGATATPGTSAAGSALAASTTVPSSIANAVPAARTAAASAPERETGSAGDRSGDGPLPALPVLGGGNGGGPTNGNVLDPILGSGGGAADPGAGGRAPGPIRTVTEPLRPATQTVGAVLRPVSTAAAPAGRTLGTVLQSAGNAITPVTNTVRPITTPVANRLDPITSPVLDGVSRVTDPILKGTEPLTGPLLDGLEPVTGLLNTSAAHRGSTGSTGSGSDGSGDSATSAGKHVLTTATDPANTITGLTDRLGVGDTLGSLTGRSGSGSSGAATSQKSDSGTKNGASSSTNQKSGQKTSQPKTGDLLGSTLGGLTGR